MNQVAGMTPKRKEIGEKLYCLKVQVGGKVFQVENCVKVSFLSVTSDFRNYSYFLLTQPVLLQKIQYNFIFSPIDHFNLDFVPS